MSDFELRFRQIHLDFHTSEAIEGVGADFDANEFAETLRKAHVDSINIFGRCHHGWMYFPSRRFPERVHPGLAGRNLLGEQIAALHERDIRCPIYLTIQWDNFSAERHPEWRVVGPDGRLTGTGPYEAGFYKLLCVNTPYRAFLAEHVTEVLETFSPDGLWLDIVSPQDCSCSRCRAGMLAEGLDASDAAARMDYAVRMLHGWMREMAALIRSKKPDCLIFFNSGHVGPRLASAKDCYTHWELESLPSGGWGYMHFPCTQRYARTHGLDALGMTGKFHTSWGDFHSFKNRAALEFECFQMLALNAKCCVGDQLHPRGRICQTTYELVGAVYEQVERKEPYCRGARPVVDLAVLTPEAFGAGGTHTSLTDSLMGAVRLLQEGAQQFDVIDGEADFRKYKLLVLPDRIPVSPALARKLTKYLAGGGALLATHRSGLNEAGDAFALEALGVRLVGEAPFSPDFLVPTARLGRDLPRTGHVMYLRAMEVRPLKGAKVLARVETPYFNRTWEHYCSHRHAPSSGKAAYPAAVRNGSAVYLAHPVFAQYHAAAPLWCKKVVLDAVAALLPEPLVRLEAPSSALSAVNHQPAERRLVLHLLHYIPERRGTAFDVIEDVIPIRDVKVSLRTDGRGIRAVTRQPEGEALAFAERAGRVEFVLPELRGHQIVALDMA